MPPTPNPPRPPVFTHIGIAFFVADGFPMQASIVLCTNMWFRDDVVLCGTVIESANGWAESWKECYRAPVEPYLTLLGIIGVAKVQKTPIEVLRAISTLGWTARDCRGSSGSYKNPYSNDYVCRVVLHLCNINIISLPQNVKNDLDWCITEILVKLRLRQASDFNVIPFVERKDVGYGHWC